MDRADIHAIDAEVIQVDFADWEYRLPDGTRVSVEIRNEYYRARRSPSQSVWSVGPVERVSFGVLHQSIERPWAIRDVVTGNRMGLIVAGITSTIEGTYGPR